MSSLWAGKLGARNLSVTKAWPSPEGGADDHFDRHWHDRFGRGPRDFRLFRRRIRIQLHHAGDIRDRFHAAQRQNHADECDPGVT